MNYQLKQVLYRSVYSRCLTETAKSYVHKNNNSKTLASVETPWPNVETT
jgi:hypothetical protein